MFSDAQRKQVADHLLAKLDLLAVLPIARQAGAPVNDEQDVARIIRNHIEKNWSVLDSTLTSTSAVSIFKFVYYPAAQTTTFFPDGSSKLDVADVRLMVVPIEVTVDLPAEET